MDFRKKVLNTLHPVLKPLLRWYSSRPRVYRYRDIRIQVLPGVFHPGLFFSTKIIIDYLEHFVPLKGKRILELGAGSGLISIFCARKNAIVTSTDLSDVAIACIHQNAQLNRVAIRVVKSDLFDSIAKYVFDVIIINPPYFPRDAQDETELAWFCGSDFSYFRKLFRQLSERDAAPLTLMILSEDCQIEQIRNLAGSNNLSFVQVYQKKVAGENNYLFEIRRG